MSRTKLPEIPASIKCGRRGSCVPAALYCLPQLVEGRDYIVEGWVSFGGRKQEHTWIVIYETIFDPTIIQFRRFRHYPAGPQYITKLRHTPAEMRVIWRATKSLWWRERLASFGVPRCCWTFA